MVKVNMATSHPCRPVLTASASLQRAFERDGPKGPIKICLAGKYFLYLHCNRKIIPLMNMLKKLIIITFLILPEILLAQNINTFLTLEQAIGLARVNSPAAGVAELNFMARYWSYRSYKAEFLPAINLSANIGNYNRSMVEVRDYETGQVKYVANNSLSNDISLSIDQKISGTGGTVSLSSSLSRLDQFNYKDKIYNSTPVSIRYHQPIRAFNSLKWKKKTEPLEYEKAKRIYLESMHDITIQTTNSFFSVLSAQTNLNNKLKKLNDTKRLYEIAKKRFDIGRIPKSELLQLELALINAEIGIGDSKIAKEMALFNLKIYLGVSKNTIIELTPPQDMPEISLDYDFVLDRALNNSSHEIALKLKAIQAQRSVAQAKGDRGIQISFNANLGYSQTSEKFGDVYSNLLGRQLAGLSITLPIFDWGLSKGRVRMAEAEQQVVLNEIEEAKLRFDQDIYQKVLKFNNQTNECRAAKKAIDIATERLEMMIDRFENGSVDVTELNQAQEEIESTKNSYIGQLNTFWSNYYEIEKLSLYDYLKRVDFNTDFDKIIDEQK